MYSKEEINKKHLEALARKNKNLANRSTSNNSSSLLSNGVSKNNSFPSTNVRSSTVNQSNSLKNVDPSKTVTKNHSQGNRFNPIPPKPFYGIQNKVTVKSYMISATKFALECSAYSSEFIEICKKIPSKTWDMKSKLWNFHIKDYDDVITKISEEKKFSVSGIPHNVRNAFRRAMDKKDEDIDISKIDPELIKMAKPFQIEGIKYGISKNGRVMIADDMGLGKTIQALGIAHYYKDSWPMLIVTPSSIRYQWSEAIFKHLPSVPAQVIQQVSSTKDFVGSDQITIISYDLMSRMVDELEKKVFGVMILDESHFLKSHKSQRTQAIYRIGKNANHIILLSGTPALSRPVELYTQIALVKKDFLTFHEYGKRYCAGEMTKFGWNFNGSSNMQELQELLKVTCLIRRMKTEVLKQLPEKLRQVVILDPHQIKAASQEMKKAHQTLSNDNINKRERHEILLQYYSDTANAKIPAVCKYVTDMIESDRKFLIFAHHKCMIIALCELLTKKNKKFIKIDGETNAETRNELVNKFQNNQNIIAAVLSITAANAGLNLTSAHLVMFAELSWNPGILCQAEDRVHRIGQLNNVVVQYLIAKSTADDHMWSLLQKKMEVLKEAGLKQDFSVKDMDVCDQKVDNKQLKMDDFVKSTNVTSKTESFETLLNDGDDGFDNIDFDNMDFSNVS